MPISPYNTSSSIESNSIEDMVRYCVCDFPGDCSLVLGLWRCILDARYAKLLSEAALWMNLFDCTTLIAEGSYVVKCKDGCGCGETSAVAKCCHIPFRLCVWWSNSHLTTRHTSSRLYSNRKDLMLAWNRQMLEGNRFGIDIPEEVFCRSHDGCVGNKIQATAKTVPVIVRRVSRCGKWISGVKYNWLSFPLFHLQKRCLHLYCCTAPGLA